MLKLNKHIVSSGLLAMLLCTPTGAYGQTAQNKSSTFCSPEQEARNKALVHAFVDEGQSGRDLEIVSKYLSPNFTDHSAPANPNFDSAKSVSLAFHQALFAAFPDFRAEVHTQVAECDKVVTYKTFHGTHENEFFGFPATNEKMEIKVIDILRMENGQVVDHWVVNNLIEQLITKSMAPK